MENEEKIITIEIKNIKKWFLLGFLILILCLELFVTYSNPVAFGDEGFHVSIARWIGTKNEYPVFIPHHETALYKENFSRLPLWNFIEASFYMLFGFNEAIIKFLMPFVVFLTGLSTYILVKKIYSENLALISSILTVTIPSFVTYSVLFYITVPSVFFLTLAFFSFLTALKTNEKKFWFLTGIFSGLALLTIIASLVIVALILLTGLFELTKKRTLQSFFQITKKYGVALILTLVIVLPWVFRNIFYYRTPGCEIFATIQGSCPRAQEYSSSFSFAGRTAEVGTEAGILKMGIIPYLQFAYGFYHSNWLVNFIGAAFIPFTFLAGLFIMLKRMEVLDEVILILVLIFIVLFYKIGGLISGRAEDTARYFLNAIPLIGLISATYLENVIEFIKKYNKYLPIVLLIIIISIAFLNFKTKIDTMSNVKKFSPQFFDACNWVKKNLLESANLLSLHTYPTMYNCERNAIWEIPDKADIVLSNNITLVKERLKVNNLTHIFVQKFSLSNVAYGQSYPISFVQFLNQHNESFKNVYENGPLLETCLRQGGCDGTIIYEVL